MYDEHETSVISLHDFNDIEGHGLRGFSNVEEKDDELKRKVGRPATSMTRALSPP
jgi:hypothetical protein